MPTLQDLLFQESFGIAMVGNAHPTRLTISRIIWDCYKKKKLIVQSVSNFNGLRFRIGKYLQILPYLLV